MQLTKLRAASVIACVTALVAVAAGTAQAAVTAVTQTASPVTPTTATLNGTVSSGGAALSYYFAYGLASKSGFSSHTAIPSIGSGNTSSTVVLAEITDLKPKTKYKFELVTARAGTAYTAPSTVSGGVLKFTTGSAGKVTLKSTKLNVKKGRVAVKFNCASTVACTGKVKITAKGVVGTKTETVACGTASFTIAAGEKLTVRTHKVSKNCAALLSAAASNTITAKLKATFTTYQPKLSKNVSLTS